MFVYNVHVAYVAKEGLTFQELGQVIGVAQTNTCSLATVWATERPVGWNLFVETAMLKYIFKFVQELLKKW